MSRLSLWLICGVLAIAAASGQAVTPGAAAAAAPAPTDPARLAAAKDLISAMRFEDTMMRVLDGQKQQFTRQVEMNLMMSPHGNATPAELGGLKQQLIDTWWAGLDPKHMLDEMAVIYANTFSVEDLKQISAFYRSAAGQHMVDHTTELGQASTAMYQRHLQAAGPKLQKLLEDFKKAHPTPAPAAGPKAAAPSASPSAAK